MRQPVSEILADKGSSVIEIAPDATVAAAVERMNEHKIGALLVVEGDEIVGIFTERDVLVRVVAARQPAERTTVREVMTPQPVRIKPTTTVEEAMVVITEQRCRHLPVVDDGVLLGMISIGDLTRWVVRKQHTKIQDLVGYITGGPAG